MTRADRVEARLDGIDALLVTDLVNLRYLTGFAGSNGFAVIGPGLRRFVTDSRYISRDVPGWDKEEGPVGFLKALATGWPEGVARVGFEDHHVSVRQFEKLKGIVPGELVAAGGLVERERAVKEPDEIEAIEAAAALADSALKDGLGAGVIGRTERAVANAIEAAMRRGGGEPAFPTIVAAGENGASPHATPRDVAIEAGQLVTIDYGARLGGYCSDSTRTFAAGVVGPELAAIHALVEEAQAAALTATVVGAEGVAVDAVARDIIAAAGHGEHFGHGLGHGVGLEVHEAPRLARSVTNTLEAGNVVTVEPGVYVPGLGGVRIEDLVVVTDEGPRTLSAIPKSVIELD